MGSIFLTRHQYDCLVTGHQVWMAAFWLTLDRSWSCGGVRAVGPVEKIDAIRQMLEV